LVLAHKDPAILRILVDELNPLGTVFLHIDKKSEGNFEEFLDLEEVFSISAVNIKWGHWSMVEATLILIREALAQGATRLTLISGNSLPIVGPKKFAELMESDLDICHNRSFRKTFNEITDDQYFRRYFATKDSQNFFSRLVNLMLRIWPIRINISKYLDPLELMIGSQWWSVTSRTMEQALIVYQENPKLDGYFKKIKLSDETFFQTLISQVSKNIDGTGTTYANWEIAGPHPGTLTIKLLEEAMQSEEFYFARKFVSDDIELLNLWRNYRHGTGHKD
jgi:hypothetical protein